MKFKVYGDYGYQSECELHESDSQNAAVRWLTEYVRQGDTGGYNILEVAYFANDGEYVTVHTIRANESDDGDDGDDYSNQSAYSYNL